jgi:alpha-beta hydrolase superfamily lysophospholipase
MIFMFFGLYVLIDKLNLKKVHLLGHDMGGIIAREFTEKHENASDLLNPAISSWCSIINFVKPWTISSAFEEIIVKDKIKLKESASIRSWYGRDNC